MKVTWYREFLVPGLVDLRLGDSAGDAEVRTENICSSVKDALLIAHMRVCVSCYIQEETTNYLSSLFSRSLISV